MNSKAMHVSNTVMNSDIDGSMSMVANNEQTYFCDISNLGKIRISGKAAHDFIQIMFSAPRDAFAGIGSSKAALLLNAQAEIIDICVIVRSGDNEYMVTTSPGNAQEAYTWISSHAQIEDAQGKVFDDVHISNEQDSLAAVVLFGPDSLVIIQELLEQPLDQQVNSNDLHLVQIDTVPTLMLKADKILNLSQAFEFYFQKDKLDGIINILMSFSQVEPLEYCQYIGLRSEAKTWFEAGDSAEYLNPIQANLMHLVRAQPDYVGANALKAQFEQ